MREMMLLRIFLGYLTVCLVVAFVLLVSQIPWAVRADLPLAIMLFLVSPLVLAVAVFSGRVAVKGDDG